MIEESKAINEVILQLTIVKLGSGNPLTIQFMEHTADVLCYILKDYEEAYKLYFFVYSYHRSQLCSHLQLENKLPRLTLSQPNENQIADYDLFSHSAKLYLLYQKLRMFSDYRPIRSYFILLFAFCIACCLSMTLVTVLSTNPLLCTLSGIFFSFFALTSVFLLFWVQLSPNFNHLSAQDRRTITTYRTLGFIIMTISGLVCFFFVVSLLSVATLFLTLFGCAVIGRPILDAFFMMIHQIKISPLWQQRRVEEEYYSRNQIYIPYEKLTSEQRSRSRSQSQSKHSVDIESPFHFQLTSHSNSPKEGQNSPQYQYHKILNTWGMLEKDYKYQQLKASEILRNECKKDDKSKERYENFQIYLKEILKGIKDVESESVLRGK
jgi:hypothetical protein